jgi:hypothetical protein
LILAFVLILARVLVGFLIGILLLGHGWNCQGCGREQRNKRSFHAV